MTSSLLVRALAALRKAQPLLPYAAQIDRFPGDLAVVDEAIEAVEDALRMSSTTAARQIIGDPCPVIYPDTGE